MDRDGEKQQTIEAEARGGELPGDMMLEVLVRLSAKALCRFRCVSKAWQALISDPTFVQAQRSRAGPHLVGVSFGICKLVPPEVTVFDMDGNVVRQLEVRLLGKDDDGAVLQLQRATTMNRRSNLICALGQLQQENRRCRIDAMIIDLAHGRASVIGTDARFTALYSIGRTAMSGAIKVISIEQCLGLAAPLWIGKVATISMNCAAEPLTWRQTRSPPPFAFSWVHGRRATVNGIVYYMAARFNEYCFGASNSGLGGPIAAFDLESERWKMINGPALEIQDKNWYATLMEIKGCLGLVQFLGHWPIRFEPYEHDCYAVIWLLVDPDKSLWVKDCTIQMPKTWTLINQLWALDDGRILLLVREFLRKVVTKKGGISYVHQDILVFFNPSTSTFTKFRDKPVWLYDKFVLYTGSLLS